MPITLDGSNGITTPTYGGADTSEYLVPVTQFKNRIINGAMVIDQRNAGASVTVNTSTQTFITDRWSGAESSDGTFSGQQSSDSPNGFKNSLLITTTAADTSLTASQFATIRQVIEGYNIADLNWGTANAKTVTLSFWVKSSLTGTFGGSLRSSGGTRSYPFSYTISSANTWEQKSITVAGDTTGTWLTDNGAGIILTLSLGAGTDFQGTASAWNSNNNLTVAGAVSVIGTLNATFYITGVQLEVGSTATSFDYRPYGTELALCQRYYESTFPDGTAPAQNTSAANALRISQTAAAAAPCRGFTWLFKTTKRTTPSTITSYNPSAANANVRNLTRSNDATISGVAGLNAMGVSFTFTGSTGSAVGDDNAVGFSADAEL